jgi:predicted MPP superfamily phosphohydrolase
MTTRFLLIVLLVLKSTLIFSQKDFSFIYLPDLHLRPDSLVISNFERLAKQLNTMHPDFVVTGGDMIYTAKNVNDDKAKMLFDLMDKEFKLFKMPVYMTMGNHENVGITVESGIDSSNANWGKKMYVKRYNKRYYSFVYDGWKFFILDGIKILVKQKNYTEGVDSVQIEWIKNELQSTDKTMPIVISIHPPLVNPEGITNPASKVITSNSATILGLFKDYNLKTVLEGHTHRYMFLYVNGIYYISGGSSSYDTDPFDFGFIKVDIKNNIEDIKFLKVTGSIH